MVKISIHYHLKSVVRKRACGVTICTWSDSGVGPMIFRDRGKRTEFAEDTLWNGIAYFKVQMETSFYESKSTYFTLFFIDFNPYPVDRGMPRLWQCWLRHMPCLHVIAEFFRFGNPLQWRHSAWLYLAFFIPASTGSVPVHDAWSNIMQISRSLPRSAEDSRITACVVWLNVGPTLAKVTGNDSTINTAMTAACALIRGCMGQHFLHRRLLY